MTIYIEMLWKGQYLRIVSASPKRIFSHARKLSRLTNDERYHIHTSKESGEAKAGIGKLLPWRDDRTRAAHAVRNVLKYRWL